MEKVEGYCTSTYQPSTRISKLRERVLSEPPALSERAIYRHYYYLEGWMAAAGASLPMRSAAALANAIEKMPVEMVAGELLVGEHAGSDDITGALRDHDEFAEEIAGSCLSADEQKQMGEWLRRGPFDFQQLAPVVPWPEELESAEQHGVIKVRRSDLTATVRAYEKVVTLGFAGLKEQIEARLTALSPTEPSAAQQQANYQAWLRVCEAGMTLGLRHAERARELAAACSDPQQRAEWEQIAEICERVPAKSARSFREALQALWFAHIITVWENGGNADAIGRIDQFLWGYLERDLAAGVITYEDAAELLAAFLIKFYQPSDLQQITLGGQRSWGGDATNPLTYLALDVIEGLDLALCLSVRLHRDSPPQFVARCVDLLAGGDGTPLIFSDEALIPTLVSNGIPLDDARSYAAVGSFETTVPGKANPHTVSHYINLAKCLELALNDGVCLLDGTQVGPKTGTLADFHSMADVLTAYGEQLTHFVQLAVYGSNSTELAQRAQRRLPYLSLLTEDSARNGLDIIEGGARYNCHSSVAVGIASAADSLAALDRVVFAEERVSPEEMLAALREDFEGRDELLEYLRDQVPKYGNNDQLPDGHAAGLARGYCELLSAYETPTGATYFPYLLTTGLLLSYGKLTGASPEGRHAGELPADSVLPLEGRDGDGVAAMFSSLSRMRHETAAAGSAAILHIQPSLLESVEQREAFAAILVKAIAAGAIGQLRVDVISAE